MNWADLLLGQLPAVLPPPAWLQGGRTLAWACVLAAAGVWVVRRRAVPVRWLVALALALWAAMPGTVSPTFWLGLAFQSPSLLGCLLCLYWLVGFGLRGGAGDGAGEAMGLRWPGGPVPHRMRVGWAGAGVLLGYLLLFDTLALLPVQLYAWGFGPVALLVALAFALLPWVAGLRGALVGLVPLALLLFALTRLPSGNLWDAVLDPITWVGLHAVLFRARAR